MATSPSSAELPVGRELDALVAEKVMGWTRPRVSVGLGERPPCPVKDFDYFNPPPELEEWRSSYFWRRPDGACSNDPPCHSTDIAAAWHVYGHLAAKGYCWQLDTDGKWNRAKIYKPDTGVLADVAGPMEMPEAISRAALRAVSHA